MLVRYLGVSSTYSKNRKETKNVLQLNVLKKMYIMFISNKKIKKEEYLTKLTLEQLYQIFL